MMASTPRVPTLILGLDQDLCIYAQFKLVDSMKTGIKTTMIKIKELDNFKN